MPKKLQPLYIGDLEIKTPIIQGAMGVKVSTASLASAVANYGGAGTIASVGLGYGTDENEIDYISASTHGLIHEIRKSKELSKGVVGVNIMVALSNYENLTRTASSENTHFIISGAGLPLPLPGYVDNKDIKLIPIVSSARAASIIIKTWKKRFNRYPDAIMIEGPKAGGHLGFKDEELQHIEKHSLENLVTEVLKVAHDYEEQAGIHLPVLAAGGIFTGKDIAKFIKLGVKGVQIATRFVATIECSVAEEFKNLYLLAHEDDTIIIKSPVGMPGRAIRTKFIDDIQAGKRIPIRCNYQCLRTCDPKTVPYCIAKALFNACSGKLDEAVVFAGSNVVKVDKIVSVQELMDELVEEANRELSSDQ